MNSDHEEQPQKHEDGANAAADQSKSEPEAAKVARDDTVVRVTKESSIRKQIGYTMKRVQAGDKMTVTGLGFGMSKAILIASIVRDRVGDVHLLNTFTEVEDRKRPEFKVTGITIVLTTKSDLDSSDIGYQHPEAQGQTFSRFQAERDSKCEFQVHLSRKTS